MSSTAENQRVNFASIKNPLPYPDFLEVQLKSFQDFLQLDTPPEKRKKEGDDRAKRKGLARKRKRKKEKRQSEISRCAWLVLLVSSRRWAVGGNELGRESRQKKREKKIIKK